MPTHQKYFHVFLGAQKNFYLFIILKKQGLRNKRYASNVCLFRIINTIKPKSISNRKKKHIKNPSPQNNKSVILRLLSTRPFSIAQSSQTQHNPTQPNSTQLNTTQLKATQSPSSIATLPLFSCIICFSPRNTFSIRLSVNTFCTSVRYRRTYL